MLFVSGYVKSADELQWEADLQRPKFLAKPSSPDLPVQSVQGLLSQ